MSLQFSSVGEANIGIGYILFFYVPLLSWVTGFSFRVIRVLGVCIPGLQSTSAVLSVCFHHLTIYF